MSDPLTDLQMKILRAVHDAGGEESTETLYDLVEEARPTMDEDGEPLDRRDPYETSREEIGALENLSLLTNVENSSAAMGRVALTAAARFCLTGTP